MKYAAHHLQFPKVIKIEFKLEDVFLANNSTDTMNLKEIRRYIYFWKLQV